MPGPVLIAAAVFDHRGVVGAIGITGAVERLIDTEPNPVIAVAVRDTARGLPGTSAAPDSPSAKQAHTPRAARSSKVVGRVRQRAAPVAGLSYCAQKLIKAHRGGSEMRVMARVSIPVEAGNRGIQSGSLPKVMQQTAERWKPEAMYFTTYDGRRTGYIVFDMTDSSDLPVFAEPFFMELNADVQVAPVMNGDDLQKGLSSLA